MPSIRIGIESGPDFDPDKPGLNPVSQLAAGRRRAGTLIPGAEGRPVSCGFSSLFWMATKSTKAFCDLCAFCGQLSVGGLWTGLGRWVLGVGCWMLSVGSEKYQTLRLPPLWLTDYGPSPGSP